jgi:hypothetical protein
MRDSWKVGSIIPGRNLGHTKMSKPHRVNTIKYIIRENNESSTPIVKD